MMASSNGIGCPHTMHHHHHHHHCPHCPLRRHCHHCPLHHNSQLFPFYLPALPRQQHHLSPLQNPTFTSLPQVSQEPNHIELKDEEEEDEPVFVLTDEWREFFAKSEARRKLEKKQGKKGKN